MMLGVPMNYDDNLMPPRQQSNGIRYSSMKIVAMFATLQL